MRLLVLLTLTACGVVAAATPPPAKVPVPAGNKQTSLGMVKLPTPGTSQPPK